MPIATDEPYLEFAVSAARSLVAVTVGTACLVFGVTCDAAAVDPTRIPSDKARNAAPSGLTRREPIGRVFSVIPQTDDFTSGNQITVVNGTAAVNLDPAGAYDNTYTVHYYVQVTLSSPGFDPYVGLTVAIESNDGNGWVERATFIYERVSSGTSTWSHEQKAVVVSGLDLNDDIRFRAKSFVKHDANGSFTIRGGDAGGSNPETYNGVTYGTSADPVVDVTPYNYAKQDYSRCAVSCFAAVYQQSTTPYFSLDAPRFVTLVYNSDRVNPRPFVHVNVSPLPGFAETPTEYRLQVKVNGAFVTFLNGEQTLRFAYPGAVSARIGGQFDAASYNTGVYPMNILVSAVYPIAGVSTKDIATKFVVVNETSSAIGAGWTLAGIERLYLQSDSSALIAAGEGSAVYFARVGGAYVSPAGEFSQLVTGTPSGGAGWTRRYPDSTKSVFNTAGGMISVLDRFNTRDTVLYDGSNRVSQVKDPLNNAITLTYDANGLTAIQDPMSRVTDVVVDASKRLTTITDPDNQSTTFGYDGSLRLRAVTNRAGKTDTLTYLVINAKETNKLVSVKAPSIPIFGGGSASPVTTFEPWHIKGVPYVATTGTAFQPPTADTVYARFTEPLGSSYVTRFTVSPWGSPAVTTNALGEVTTVVYHNSGLPWTILRPGFATRDTLLYNGDGLVTYSRPAGDSATTITYGGWAQPTSVATPGRPTVTYGLGANGRVNSVTWGGVTRQSYLYDSFGRLTRVTDALLTVLRRLGYPTSGSHRNLTNDTLPGVRVTVYGYDTYGRRTTVTPPAPSPQQITHYSIVNRMDSVRVLTNPVTRVKFAYDQLGRDTMVTDPLNQVYRYVYNAVGWPIKQVDPVGARDTLHYNVGGELRRSINRRGQSIDYSYDVLHRMTSRAGSNTSTWTYIANSLVVTETQPGVATVTTYPNLLGMLDSMKTVLNGYTYWQRYHYTSAGLDSTYFTGSQDANHLTVRRYRYNPNSSALDSISLATSRTILSHDANMSTTTTDFPGSTISSRTLGSLQATLTSTTEAGNNNSLERWLGFNNLGQIDRHLQYPGKVGRWFAYDSLGQLRTGRTRIQTPEGSLPPSCPNFDYGMSGACTPNIDYVTTDSVGYAYDAVGNRTDQGGSYTSANRITSFASCTYKTDAAGNVVSRKGTTPCVQIDTLLWTVEGWLDSVKVGSTGIKFLYDADGRLTAKRVNGNFVSWFLWDGTNLLAELSGTRDAVVTEYSYYGIDALHAVIKQPSGQRLYARMDGLGNVLAFTDTSGSIQSSYVYGDWGGSSQGADGNRARWKDALWMGPEIDLYYMRNRWYEPHTGRFLSEDPIGLAGGINNVAFAGNDPVNGADPTGQCLQGFVVGVAVYGLVVAAEHKRFNFWAAAGSGLFGLATCGLSALVEAPAAAMIAAGVSRGLVVTARVMAQASAETANLMFAYGVAEASSSRQRRGGGGGGGTSSGAAGGGGGSTVVCWPSGAQSYVSIGGGPGIPVGVEFNCSDGSSFWMK